MSVLAREFLKEINENVSLVLWVSDQNLCLQTSGLKECDYLTDGLVSDYLKNHEQVSQALFHSQNYGATFFIAFFKLSKSTLAEIDDVLALIDKDKGSKKIVYIQSGDSTQEKKEFLSELNRRYKQFEIKNYVF